MRYASVCSGVEAASLAWEFLGWEPAFFSEIEPFPCAVLASRWPKVPNLGDMSKIEIRENGEIRYGLDKSLPDDGKPIDLLVGGTPCFVAGTLILTPSGYRPIEEIKVGDEVVNAEGEIDTVTAAGHKKARVGEIKIQGRPAFTCTPGHPFLTVAMKTDNRRSMETCGRKVPEGGFEFTKARDSEGRYAGRVKKAAVEGAELDDGMKIKKGMLFELAGWYAGCGCVQEFTGMKNRTVLKQVVLTMPGRVRKFMRLAGRLSRFGNLNVVPSQTDENEILIFNTWLAEWLSRNFGGDDASKRVPYWLYGDKDAGKFVKGYEDSSPFKKKGRVQTVSKALACGYADLTGNGSVYLQKNTGKTVWEASRPENGSKAKFIDGRWASLVRSWKNNDTTRTVYNITVGNGHTYVVEGIAVHNCQDASTAGKREGLVKGSRSSLAFSFTRLAYELAARKGLRWLLWENVPGVFTLNDGRDFALFLSSLCGRRIETPDGGWGNFGIVRNTTDGNFGLCWRVLDVQHARVDGWPRAIPQRRRRIFLVGHLGSWQSAAQILFERQDVLGHIPPRREALPHDPAPAGEGAACGD
ncbi:MAG: DNA cytosine methyltransferase [Clostridia bacterium]|nr:DNA cytosine methyltransferase [Clostridia bacterium]